MKRWKHWLLIFTLLFALVGCKATPPEEKEGNVGNNSSVEETEGSQPKESKDTIVFMHSEINATLDPTKPQSDGYMRRVGALEPLFYVTNEGDVYPKLAEGAEALDPTHWNIKLRENAKFWSGKEVTAEEVIKSLERSRELNTGAEAALKGLTFEAAEPYLIKVTSEQENVNVPLKLISVSITNADLDHTSVDQIDFTGMYRIKEYLPKQRLILERNEDYYGDLPKIKNVNFEEISDPETRLMAVISGEADIASAISPTGAKQAKDNPKVNIVTSNASNTLSVYLNLQHDILKDVKVRQALNWGTNRQEIVDIHTEGFGMPVSTWLGSNPKFPETKNAVYDHYDLEKANALLDEAGWKMGDDGIRQKEGVPFHFKLYTFGAEKVLGEMLQSQWKKMGIDVDLHHVEYSVIKQARETGDWDGLVESWTHFGDMYSIISNHFGPNGSINYGKYSNPEVDTLLEELLGTADEEKAHDIVVKINEIIAKDGVLVPMMPRPTLNALNPKLKGFEVHFIQHESYITNKLEFAD